MKTNVLTMFLLGFATLGYSQAASDGGNNEQSLKMEELPEVVIKNAGKDFSVYFPDNVGDKNVRKLEEEFIAYSIGKDYEGFDNYLVILESNTGTLTATYNENGKLTNVVEKYQGVKLPSAVVYSIYRNYPGWEIINNKYLYTQKEGKIDKKQYVLKLKKDKETVKLIVHSDGEIVSR